MSLRPDRSVAAAVFDDRPPADEAWGLLARAGIDAAVIVDPGMLGAYKASVMVERDDLDEAMEVLAPFVNARRDGGGAV